MENINEKLPEEMVRKVLSFLPLEDLKNACLTCTYWKGLSDTLSTFYNSAICIPTKLLQREKIQDLICRPYRNIRFDTIDFFNETLRWKLSNVVKHIREVSHNNIVSVQFVNCNFSRELLMECLKKFPSLRELVILKDCDFMESNTMIPYPEDDDPLDFSANPKLESMTLECFEELDMEEYMELYEMSFELDTVNLTYDIVKDLPTAINLNLKALKINSFSSFLFVCDGCSRKWNQLLQNFLATQSEMREFVLDSSVPDKLIKSLSTNCPKLEHLTLRMQREAHFNFSLFSPFRNLTSLTLKIQSDKRKSVPANAFRFFVMKKLKVLKISGLKLDKKTTEMIKRNNPNLQYLMEAI